MTKIALVGTGFVADYYMTTLANYPGLVVAGTWDRDAGRLAQFCRFHDLRAYGSLEECLGDGETDILVNLTSPDSHFELNCAALNAGKHVYCEKPLGMTFEEARAVIELADGKGLTVCGAPANGLSDAQQLVAGLIEAGRSADFVLMDRAQHSPANSLLESVRLGDLPGVGMVIIDGLVRAGSSRNTPPATRIPAVIAG